jgi:hypothetical protein
MCRDEEMRSEEAARHDRFDGWDDIDADFEARCDDAIVEDKPPMNDEDTWQAWLDLQSDPEYRADFPKPDGVYCV